MQRRSALVVGGATLLGRAVAEVFTAAGYRVAVADCNEDAGRALAAEMGPGLLFLPLDITDESAVEACVAEAAAQGAPLQAVVTMVADYRDPGLSASCADWLQSLAVNVVGPALVARAAVAHLSRGGVIVNVTSVSGERAQPHKLLYPAGKGALLQLGRNLAMELAPRGIRVNSVSPSWVWSVPMERRSGGDREFADEVAADFHMLDRMADPHEVAHAIRFLCSDEASFITGETLHVDGGYCAMSPEGKVNPWVRYERAHEMDESDNSPSAT